jgi:carboxyl-terminal processing protease
MILSERRSRRPSWLQVTALCLLVAVSTGYALTKQFEARSGEAGTYAKLDEIRALVDAYYVGEYSEEDLMDMLARGFAYGINDRWAYYTPKSEMDFLEESFTGVYAGIGVTVNRDISEGYMSVLDVFEGSPAEEAGLLPLDKIYAVDGQSVVSLGRDGTVAAVRGEEGTSVTLTVLRGEEELSFTIVRRRITQSTVYTEVLNGTTGYMRISEFNMATDEEFTQKLEAMKQLSLTGLIVDLRNNPGGQLDSLIHILDELMPEGVAFIQRNKAGEELQLSVDAEYWDIPLVVLVNQYSYSAAEYFAAVLQEVGRAQVVGEKTTGKGEAQHTFMLSDGSAISFSVLKYFTPEGVSIAEQGGIVPDVEVDLPEELYAMIGRLAPEEDAQLAQALALVE